MGLKGDISNLRRLKRNLRDMPTTLAASVAQRAAPALTGLAQDAYGGNVSVYGDPRPAGVDGRPLTLERSGATRRTLRFTATGTIVRCVLGTRYARYLIGKYGILPNGPLPVAWSRKLGDIVKQAKVPL
jgi:hypothetical protein